MWRRDACVLAGLPRRGYGGAGLTLCRASRIQFSFAQLREISVRRAVAALVTRDRPARSIRSAPPRRGMRIYDPCAPGIPPGHHSGSVRSEQARRLLPLVSGLHFHTLCEQNSDDLETTAGRRGGAISRKWLPQMKWVNFGGGHHITQRQIMMWHGCLGALYPADAGTLGRHRSIWSREKPWSLNAGFLRDFCAG